MQKENHFRDSLLCAGIFPHKTLFYGVPCHFIDFRQVNCPEIGAELSAVIGRCHTPQSFPQMQKENHFRDSLLSVGINLFSRSVARQVSSSPASLTSVFEMGTGGPSPQSIPTIQLVTRTGIEPMFAA